MSKQENKKGGVRRGCPGQLPWSAAPASTRPRAVVLDGRQLHSPPPLRKCSAVASPSVLLPPPFRGARQGPGQTRALGIYGAEGRRPPEETVALRRRFPPPVLFRGAFPPQPRQLEEPVRKTGRARYAVFANPAETSGAARRFRLWRRAARKPDESAPKRNLEPKDSGGVVDRRPPPPGWRRSCFLLGTNPFADWEMKSLEPRGCSLRKMLEPQLMSVSS